MAVKFKKASRFFNKFLRATLGNYMRCLFGFQIFNNEITGLKPPYIVLSNHTNLWDPFLLSMCFKDPVYFVASDIHFRNSLLRWLLRLVGAIAKTKNVSDPKTIKEIITVVKNGGIIGIFPEGQRSWDGKTLPLLYPTAKLVKSLKLPIVTVVFKGGYLSMPRWAKKPRKGELHMVCKKLLSSEEISRLNVEEIYAKLTEGLRHDEYEYQREKMNRYKSHIPAERLELFLFCCPHCRAFGSLKSENRSFTCAKCGYTVQYNDYGFLESAGGKLYYDNPRDWNQWQLSHLSAVMEENASSSTQQAVFEDNDVILHSGTGERHQPLKLEQTGRLILFSDSIRFEGQQGMQLSVPLGRITGENVQLNSKLEFYHEKTLYRLTNEENTLPAYKWVKAIEIFKSQIKDNGSTGELHHLGG